MSTENIITTILGVMLYIGITVMIQDWLEKSCQYSKFKSAILALTWPAGAVIAIILFLLTFLLG